MSTKDLVGEFASMWVNNDLNGQGVNLRGQCVNEFMQELIKNVIDDIPDTLHVSRGNQAIGEDLRPVKQQLKDKWL